MTAKSKKTAEPDIQEASRLLQEVELQKLKLCAAEIAESLQKYECGMIPEMLFRGTKLLPQVLLVTRSGMSLPLRPVQPIQTIQQPIDE